MKGEEMAYVATCHECDKPFMLVADRPDPVRDSAREIGDALMDGHRVDRMTVREAKALASFGWCECYEQPMEDSDE